MWLNACLKLRWHPQKDNDTICCNFKSNEENVPSMAVVWSSHVSDGASSLHKMSLAFSEWESLDQPRVTTSDEQLANWDRSPWAICCRLILLLVVMHVEGTCDVSVAKLPEDAPTQWTANDAVTGNPSAMKRFGWNFKWWITFLDQNICVGFYWHWVISILPARMHMFKSNQTSFILRLSIKSNAVQSAFRWLTIQRISEKSRI